MIDPIDRQVAIDALWKALYAYEDKTERQFIESDELDVGDWIEHRAFVQNMSDIDRQTILELPSEQPECDDTVSRKAEIDAIKRYIRGFDAIDVNFLDGLKTAIQIIEQLPHEYSHAQNTLQRVGSVECEDVDDDDFCSRGERKDG